MKENVEKMVKPSKSGKGEGKEKESIERLMVYILYLLKMS